MWTHRVDDLTDFGGKVDWVRNLTESQKYLADDKGTGHVLRGDSGKPNASAFLGRAGATGPGTPSPPRKAVRFTGRRGIPNHGLGEGAELRGRAIPLPFAPTDNPARDPPSPRRVAGRKGRRAVRFPFPTRPISKRGAAGKVITQPKGQADEIHQSA